MKYSFSKLVRNPAKLNLQRYMFYVKLVNSSKSSVFIGINPDVQKIFFFYQSTFIFLKYTSKYSSLNC